jgi:hypothetical protein
MNRKAKVLIFSIVTIAVFSLTVGTSLAQQKLTELSPVFIDGMGPIRVGMTVAEASRAAGVRLVRDEPLGDCSNATPQGNPRGVSFMVTGNRISRVNVYENRRVATGKLARIGDTEARIKSLYPGRIQVSQHQYVRGGHYLTFVPKDRSDRNYRLIFETDGKRVTSFRSGKLPEVEYVEGCA